MQQAIVIGCILVCCWASFAAPATQPAGADEKGLDGTWLPTKAELGGAAFPEAVLKSIRLELNGGQYTAWVGESPDKGTYSIDTATDPKGMTVIGTEGPNAGKTFPAVYELTGDTLRICYDLSGAKRPAEFKSIAGTKLYLVSYSRKK